MADDAVYDAVKAYLSDPANVAVLADPGTGIVPPFRWENETFVKPDPPAPWISAAIVGVVYGQQSIGASDQADNLWEETGHLWLPVFVPTGSGASRARQLARRLQNIFRGLTLLDGDLEFMECFTPDGAPAPEEGNWFKLEFAVEWRRLEA